MRTIHEILGDTTLGSRYSHLLEQPSLPRRFIKNLFELYCKALFTLYCPLTVEGRENIPKSSFIFCSNHNSHMDSAILMLASGLSFKRFGMLAATDYFFKHRARQFFLGSFMNLIPIDRNPGYKTIAELTLACREFTKSGIQNIIIFPEGTRSVTGKIQPFKKGPALIATELDIPMVPAYIQGTYKAMPKGRTLMKPHRITALIGEPLYPAQLRQVSDNGRYNSSYRRLTEELRNRVLELREECNGAS